MFAPGDFGPPAAAQPLRNSRLIGLLLLLVFFVACMGFSLAMDQAVFIPFAPTYAATLTAAAQVSPTPQPTRTPNARPTRISTPLPGEQQAGLDVN